MSKWRELAAEALRRTDAVEPAADRTEWNLPPGLEDGLRLLRNQRAPKGMTKPKAWPDLVRDALALADGGWAAYALALGWSDTDLFGIGRAGEWEFAGLAAWLNGRSILALDERVAIVTDGTGRDTFNRGGMGHGTSPDGDAVLLWHWGRRS